MAGGAVYAVPGGGGEVGFVGFAAAAFLVTTVAVIVIFARGEAVRRAEVDALRAREVSPLHRDRNAPEARRAVPQTACDVFISYKRDERREVIALAHRLENLHLSVWFDAELRSGTTFDAEIEKHVRRARCVLVCWSPGAVASEWVRAEATIGRQRGVLAACMLKECELPPPFNLVHTEDLTNGIGVQNTPWLRLLERIGELTGRPGLAAYEAAQSDRAQLAAWLAAYPNDPLFDSAVAQIKA